MRVNFTFDTFRWGRRERVSVPQRCDSPASRPRNGWRAAGHRYRWIHSNRMWHRLGHEFRDGIDRRVLPHSHSCKQLKWRRNAQEQKWETIILMCFYRLRNAECHRFLLHTTNKFLLPVMAYMMIPIRINKVININRWPALNPMQNRLNYI